MVWRSGNSWLASTNLFCHLPSVNSLIIMALCAYIKGLAQYSQILQGRTVGLGITNPPICRTRETIQYCLMSAWPFQCSSHYLPFEEWAQQHPADFTHFWVKIARAAPILKCTLFYNLFRAEIRLTESVLNGLSLLITPASMTQEVRSPRVTSRHCRLQNMITVTLHFSVRMIMFSEIRRITCFGIPV